MSMETPPVDEERHCGRVRPVHFGLLLGKLAPVLLLLLKLLLLLSQVPPPIGSMLPG